MKTEDQELRTRAMARLKKKRDLKGHLLAYVLINLLIVAIWALTDAGGFFWPIFLILGWGIGVVFNAWDVYGREPSEEQIDREIDHLLHH